MHSREIFAATLPTGEIYQAAGGSVNVHSKNFLWWINFVLAWPAMSGCGSHAPRACSRQCPRQRCVASARRRGQGALGRRLCGPHVG